MLNHKQHKRDSILIRDLIITIGQLNRYFTESNLPIFLYAGVRVEIAKALPISRNEIDKYLVDHGYKLQWHGQYSVEKYPIHSIIENRIRAIEKRNSGKSNSRTEIWASYFARDIYGVSPKRFITEITWCNPRDVVNLFNLASRSELHYPNYNTNVFHNIMEDYSNIAWNERAEELNSEHSMTVVNAIKHIISNWYNHFKIDFLQKRIEDLSINNNMVKQIDTTLGAERICRDLYHVGILGQSTPTGDFSTDTTKIRRKIHETWFYRDNREFDPQQWMVIHKSLYSTLKIRKLNANDFGLDDRFT